MATDELTALIEAAKRGDLPAVQKVLETHWDIVNEADELGATALHHAAFEGHSDVARYLVKHGANVNARDNRFNATPAGWAIEYLREMGGLLGIELNDFAFAIERGDVEWVKRFLLRLPALRNAVDSDGTPFIELAKASTNPEIIRLFQNDAP